MTENRIALNLDLGMKERMKREKIWKQTCLGVISPNMVS
jgi:hypothetical protein